MQLTTVDTLVEPAWTNMRGEFLQLTSIFVLSDYEYVGVKFGTIKIILKLIVIFI